MHTHWWRSLYTSDSVSECPRKSSVQSSSGAGRCLAAVSCGSSLHPALRAVTTPGIPDLPTTTRRDQHSSSSPQVCTPAEAVECCSKSSVCLEIKINRVMSAEQAPGDTHGNEPCLGKVYRKTLW